MLGGTEGGTPAPRLSLPAGQARRQIVCGIWSRSANLANDGAAELQTVSGVEIECPFGLLGRH